jgi:hypothetical protein
MRLVLIMTLLTLALYFHGVFGDTPGAPESEYIDELKMNFAIDSQHGGELNMETFCQGDTTVSAEYDLCFKKAQVGDDECEKLGKQSLCFPKCFCDNTLGSNFMTAMKKACPRCLPVARARRARLGARRRRSAPAPSPRASQAWSPSPEP